MAGRRSARRDESVSDLLIRAGVPASAAKTVAALATLEGATAADLQVATGLRQPEVSTVVRDLRERGWIEKRDRKREGKGRPVHVYRLRKPFRAIVEDVGRDVRARVQDLEDAIARLKRASR